MASWRGSNALKDGTFVEATNSERGGDVQVPSYTVEYDVVACQDFKEDRGRWVRLMPEEIRAVNPDFVPG